MKDNNYKTIDTDSMCSNCRRYNQCGYFGICNMTNKLVHANGFCDKYSINLSNRIFSKKEIIKQKLICEKQKDCPDCQYNKHGACIAIIEEDGGKPPRYRKI